MAAPNQARRPLLVISRHVWNYSEDPPGELLTQLSGLRPHDMRVLTCVELESFQVILATGPNDGDVETLREPSLEIH